MISKRAHRTRRRRILSQRMGVRWDGRHKMNTLSDGVDPFGALNELRKVLRKTLPTLGERRLLEEGV